MTDVVMMANAITTTIHTGLATAKDTFESVSLSPFEGMHTDEFHTFKEQITDSVALVPDAYYLELSNTP